jgi:NADH:ubiquinone oxidoreductase subunit C
MTPGLTLDFVKDTMKELGTAEQVRSNRIRVATTPEMIRIAAKVIMDSLECNRLVTISTADNGITLEIFYHFTGSHKKIITLAINLPRDTPEIESMADILIPAGIYERQIHDLFGIFFRGHPDLQRIILNEDWPPDEFPLRKDWKKNPDTFYGGIKPEKI